MSRDIAFSITLVNRGYTRLTLVMTLTVAACSKLTRQVVMSDSSSFMLALDFLTAFFMLHACLSVIRSDYSTLGESGTTKIIF